MVFGGFSLYISIISVLGVTYAVYTALFYIRDIFFENRRKVQDNTEVSCYAGDAQHKKPGAPRY